MKKIILVGAGGHAKTVADTLKKQKDYEIAGFVEQKENDGKAYLEYSVIGTDKELEKLYNSGIHYAAVTIGYLGKSDVREKLYQMLKRIGYILPVIIDNTAVVADDAFLDEGTYVGRNAVINVSAHIGKMCIVNTSAIAEHECKIGDFTHIAVGAVMCGGAEVGQRSLIGANSTVLQNIKIGNQVIVGAGTVITKNIKNNVTVISNGYRDLKILERQLNQ